MHFPPNCSNFRYASCAIILLFLSSNNSKISKTRYAEEEIFFFC